MAKIALTTNLNQQTIEQTLLAVDPTGITFGTLGDAVFGTATAWAIRRNGGTAGSFHTTRLDITTLSGRSRCTVQMRGGDTIPLPNFSNYRWSEALGDVPTRVVFNLMHVTGVDTPAT